PAHRRGSVLHRRRRGDAAPGRGGPGGRRAGRWGTRDHRPARAAAAADQGRSLMRLGLYYDLRNPGGARSWARVYAAALDRIGWADGAGIGAIWVTEHHGLADGYLPAP